MNRIAIASSLFLLVSLSSLPVGATHTAIDTFDYPVETTSLEGLDGGNGWLSSWSVASGTLNINTDGTSLDSAAYPFSPIGDRVYSPLTSSGTAVRQFQGIDMGQDGNVLFASFLAQKYSASSTENAANVELRIGTAASTQPIRVGLTSPNGLLLSGTGVGNNNLTTDPDTLPLGDPYFIVMKVTSNVSGANDRVQVTAFGPGDTVPTTEAGLSSWMLERDDYLLNALNDRVYLTMGANAESAIDELRLGYSWGSVTDPNFIPGDFDGLDGLDAKDYQIWKNNVFTGTTYAQGDFNGSGLTDMRDFVLLREAWNQSGIGAFPGTVVPEPSAFALIAMFSAAGAVYFRKATRNCV